MKKEENIDNTEQQEILKETTPDVKIIDLDKLADEESIDYDKISQEDSLTLDMNSDSHAHSRHHEKRSMWDFILKINWHVVLLLVLAFSVFFVFYRIKNWGTRVDLDNLGDIDDTLYDVEVLDNFLPLIYEGDAPAMNDGITNVVLFGNDTLAQNRGTSDDIAVMIEGLTDANVYNCAVTDSFLASKFYFIGAESSPMDAFTLYWMTTAFAIDNTEPFDSLFEDFGDQLSPDARTAYDTMCSIDFNTVDVIGILYDANDYLAGKPLTNMENPTDVVTFTGNLEASIELIQETYPHIRIIVMSPTYAYAINESGDYVSSDMYCYLEDYKLSTYALMLERSASSQGVSFVDNIYGTINENNADQYLLDNINLNIAGRKKIAERFVEALTYYDEKE